MNGVSGSSQVPLDLAMPGAQRSVQHWVGEPANRSGTPIRTVPAPHPQVIFAERKPRLTQVELLARHGVVLAESSPSGRPNLSVVTSPEAPEPPRHKVRDTRVLRWLMFLAALMIAASTPMS